MNNEARSPWWRQPTKLPFAVFLAIGAYFVWTEHRVHIIEYLPWLLVLVCVGMHFFMHGGRGRRHRNDSDADQRPGEGEGSER